MSEMNGNYLNEESHIKAKNSLKKTAKILMIVGGILALPGLALLIYGIVASVRVGILIGWILLVIGSVTAFLGIAAILIANTREITSYTASSVAPVLKETVDYTTNKKASTAKAKSNKFCSKCGNAINEDDNFCSNCGARVK